LTIEQHGTTGAGEDAQVMRLDGISDRSDENERTMPMPMSGECLG
jgi:hypothetical protein